ncbi:hypothetical protein ACIHCX_09410 [Streptomyces sp. NPDC052043]|uniref:hypothetical protein n=1 Tax=Streptomyces sp. NPDC052043 TaxID=3365684 RepID=UPI0037CE907B
MTCHPAPSAASPYQQGEDRWQYQRKSIGVVDGMVLAASSTAAAGSTGIGLGPMASIVGPHLPAITLLHRRSPCFARPHDAAAGNKPTSTG